MAGSPQWKLYTAEGEYEASAKHPETLAACIGILGPGATIRWGHGWKLWTEGPDGDGEAYDSYDRCAALCWERLAVKQQEAYDKQHRRNLPLPPVHWGAIVS